MAQRAIGVLITRKAQQKKSNPVGIAIVAVLGLLWFHYYGGFAAWFSQATGGPAQHVEKSDR